MRNKIVPPLSLNKRDYRQNRTISQPTPISNSTSRIYSNQLSEICDNIYQDLFPLILRLTKSSFLDKLNKKVDEIISSTNTQRELQISSSIKAISNIKDNIIKKYDNDYNILSKEYQNYIKNNKQYNYLIHYRKHCAQTDIFALHHCSNRRQGKFIEIKTKNKYKEETSYVICIECKQCYLSSFILMICLPCNKKYFSTVLQEKEDENLFPATWEKYHCGTMINELMKCVKCHHNLNLDLNIKKLVCPNKNCNFVSKPESILWKCFICSKDFRSKAKVYNPLEFQILKKAIKFSLLLKKKAAPKELPCGCEKDISKLTFYHKEKCRGELYQGILIDKEIIVCSKCHSINFEEKYNWICPICSIKFHLHSILGCKPFSKKKYVINKRCNKSAKNVLSKKHNMEYKEKGLNNINLYNKKENEIERLAKDLNPKNSKKPITVEIKDPGLKNSDTFFETSNNENNKKFLDLKKPKHLTGTYERKKRHYSTLIEILQKRKQTNLRNSTNDIRMDKNKKDNKKEDLNRTMIVSQSMNDNLFSTRKEARYYKYKAIVSNKYSEKEIIDNYKKDIKYNDKTYIKNKNDACNKANTNESNYEKKYVNKTEKALKFRNRLNYKIPSFNADETLKNNNNKAKEILRNAESTDFSSYKTLSSKSNIRYNNNLFNTLTSVNNSSRLKNPLYSFLYRNKKSNTNSSDSKVLDTLRFSKLNDQENSYQDMFTDLPPLSKNIETDNSSLRLSLIDGNNKLIDAHDYTYKKNNNNDKNQKMEEIEEKNKLNYKSPRNRQRKNINYDNINNDIDKDDEDNNNNGEINIKNNDDEDDNQEEETIGKKEDNDETKGKLEEEEEIDKEDEDETKGRFGNDEKIKNINDKINKVKNDEDNDTKGKLEEDEIKSNLNDEEDDLSNKDEKLNRKGIKGKIEKDNRLDDDEDNSTKINKKETKGKIELDESNSKEDDDNSSQKYEDNTFGKLIEDKDNRKDTYELEETNGKLDNSVSEDDKIEENKNQKLYKENRFKMQKIHGNNEDENEDESVDKNKKDENNEGSEANGDKDKDNKEEIESSENNESSVNSEKSKKNQIDDSKKKDGSESQESESFDEENEDKFNSIPYPTNIKKNARESFILNSDIIFQSVLISQDNLNSLASKTSIPTIDENDYDYIKSIGEGSYGIVYLVQNKKTLEQFALKKIVCRDFNELIKHKNELELNFSIKHKHILSLCGLQFKYLDETTSSIYVLMELAQNDWNKEIKRRMLAKKYYKEFEIVAILKQIIQGFLYLQEKNISHRDVKPQNILLFPNNVYKIADFGEAKNIKNIAQQNTLRGSQLYMSPVLYKGYKFNKKNVLHNPYKSDVFSLGYCLLYAICLNLKVLESLRELTTMRSIKSCVNKYLINHQYSDKIMNIIYKMIEPNEDQRLDFEDLLEELDKNF